MPEVADTSAWVRLGRLLEQRRVTLDSRYSNLALFAEERGINYRTAWDVEQARRTNFRRPTRLAIDVAYGWEPGSADRVLDGGEPRIAKQDPEPAPEAELIPQCIVERGVFSTPGISREFKLLFARQHRGNGHIEDCGPFEAADAPRAAEALAG